MTSVCVGFQANPFRPQTCKECGHPATNHAGHSKPVDLKKQGKLAKDLKLEKRQALLKKKHGAVDEDGNIIGNLSDDEDDFRMEIPPPKSADRLSASGIPKIKNLLDADDIETGNFQREISMFTATPLPISALPQPELQQSPPVDDTRMEIARTEIKFLTQEVSVLTKEIDRKTQEISDLHKAHTLEVADNQKQIFHLTGQVQTSSVKISDLKATLFNLEDALQALRESQSKQISDLSQLSSSKDMRIGELESDLCVFKLADESKALELRAAQEEVAALGSSIQQKQDQVAELETEITALKTVRSEEVEISEVKDKQISDLQSSLCQASQQAEMAENSKDSLESEIRRLLFWDDRCMDGPPSLSSDAPLLIKEIHKVIAEKWKLKVDLERSHEEISRLNHDIQRPGFFRNLAPILNCVWLRGSSEVSTTAQPTNASLLRTNYQNF